MGLQSQGSDDADSGMVCSCWDLHNVGLVS